MLENEENLQAALKKLRIDSQGSTASLPPKEGILPREPVRTANEAKMKNTCTSKESWHWALRKSLRGTIKMQRCRWSKSPVLHPSVFNHNTIPVQKNQTAIPDGSSCVDGPIPKEFSKSRLVTYSINHMDKIQKQTQVPVAEISKNTTGNRLVCPCPSTAVLKATDLSGFQSPSEENKENQSPCANKISQCKQWQDMKVYKFSSQQDSPQCEPKRTASLKETSQSFPSRTPSSSFRSCSEQARAPVDDVTIEDLSGYMENFLYIPKEMSHMAEMMYT